MSLRSPLFSCLPDETARVARAAFPRGNPYLRMYDTLGTLFAGPDFADRYPEEGQPAVDPALLALVTIFQFVEGLPDRQALDAVRGRIDWKYALCLPLEDEGFDASVLSEFRARLIAGGAERRLFETVLGRLQDEALVKPRGRQRTDSTHVLAAIQVLSRLECLGEMLRHALDTLARVAPDWLRAWAPAAWFDRYGQRFQDYRARPAPEQIAPWRLCPRAHGCGRCPPSRSCGAAGCSSSTPVTRCAGGPPRICRPPRACSPRRMTPRRATVASGRLSGWGTRSI